ncbi:arabinofuranosyltransferase [Actinomycetospora termitidis]|uniref:Galactan 5-O-arabinofuranosyltransferase n=1 Tax=Actinomycetospora termitidis TaxID=3053470 RepID=A0ABT7M1Z0_9PSEU|nr:arabinofuranosyltransferase [Actinomycetospora sp. Odt1-22]MDL5154669.1 arabinofuranosyltransferase [Actinomycetospora sp. Odt1-22]
MFIAALTSIALQLAIGRLRIPFPTYAASAIAATCSALVMAALVWVAASDRRAARSRYTLVTCALLAALPSLWLGLLLQGTRWYLGGISIDQSFRTQNLARFASTTSLVDMNYLDLPSYYPAAWFWLGGRFADLTGLPAWAAYKPWSILTLAVASGAALFAWRLVVRPARAVLVATATVVVGLGVSATEPYAWLLVAPMPAVAAIVWRAVRSDHSLRRVAALLGSGVYLGIAAVTYSLHAGFFGTFVVLAALVPTRGRRLGELLPRLGRAGLVLGTGLVLSLVVWAPYLLAVLSGDPTRSYAQRYLPSNGAFWSFPMLQPSSVGAMCLVGLFGIVLGWTSSVRLARPLGLLGALVLGWYALTVPLLLVGQTSLAFRLEPVIELVLVCAGVLTAVEVVRLLRLRVPNMRLLGGVLAVVVLAACAQGAISPDGQDVKEAYADPYPTGMTPTGGVDRSRIDAWTPELLAAVHEATGTPSSDLVTLGGPTQFYVAEPFHGFQQSTPHYANPLAQYEARNDAIRSWATAREASDLVRQLDAAPWPTPRVFVLLRQPDGSGTTRIVEDAFPASPNVAFETVTFPGRLFDSPSFQVREVGPYLVAVRR